MIKYVYQVIDSNNKVAYDYLKTRKDARHAKRACEECVHLQEPLGEVPPYKIIRYKLLNPEVVR